MSARTQSAMIVQLQMAFQHQNKALWILKQEVKKLHVSGVLQNLSGAV